MRATFSLTGRIAAEDLPDRMRAELIALYLAWRDDADGHAGGQ